MRKNFPSYRHSKRIVRSNICEVVKTGASRGAFGMINSAPSFTKVLKSKDEVHTSIRHCGLVLPKVFCEEHKVAKYVTMTDSTGHTLWHMSRNNKGASQNQPLYNITNGWKEFSYDHGLKRNDKLVFTLLSPSHFVVKFATRAMRPTRDGKEYPWRRTCYSLSLLNGASEDVHSMAMATPSKQTGPEREMLKQSNRVSVENQETRNAKNISMRLSKRVLEGSASATSGSIDMSTPPSFTKRLTSKYQIHGSFQRYCELILPKQFCEKHKVANQVTMTDSTRHTLWHMRCQSSFAVARGTYRITNGWREFAYDHSLKRNDELVFTLLSPSSFLVEFASSKGLSRVMRPTRDGKDYPWARLRKSAWRNFSEKVQGLALATKASKQTPELRNPLRRCQYTQKVENRVSNSNDSTNLYSLSELTHLECRNPDGTSYLQLLDSDSDVTDGDEGVAPEENGGDFY